MKRILVITFGYPDPLNPQQTPFVKELVKKWQRAGVEVSVVKPIGKGEYQKLSEYYETNEKERNVFFPLFESVRYPHLMRFSFFRKLAVKKTDKNYLRSIEDSVDVASFDCIYSHFLNAGYYAAKLSEKYKIPAFCAVGESSLWSIEGRDMTDVRKTLGNIRAFVSVSSDNKKILVENDLAEDGGVRVFPNGVDHSVFYRRDKKAMRKKYGFPENERIGVFVGHFIDRKGPLRVAEAVKDISDLKMIYIGKGEQAIPEQNVLFCGPVEHDLLPEYLSCGDFFVLPTKNEGCCNAIIEAMACGLPVISSDRSFNDDILDDGCSIRIDPESVADIRNAVLKIMSDDKRLKNMSDNAVKKAEGFDIEKRADAILEYLEKESSR